MYEYRFKKQKTKKNGQIYSRTTVLSAIRLTIIHCRDLPTHSQKCGQFSHGMSHTNTAGSGAYDSGAFAVRRLRSHL
jgi:hypothetical protein